MAHRWAGDDVDRSIEANYHTHLSLMEEVYVKRVHGMLAIRFSTSIPPGAV